MFKLRVRLAAAALAGAMLMSHGTARAQDTEVTFAIPSTALVFTSHYVAEDGGFFKKEGLKVNTRLLVGVASSNAVLAGSADFTMGTGPVFLRAAAQGQKFLAIANMVERPMVEMVLRKDVADRLGIKPDMPLAERAKRLKGTTIAVQGVGSIIHAWERYVVAGAGLDVENDVRIAPMDPPAMYPAMLNKSVDGYVMSAPFTTQAIVKGEAIMLASSVFDAPELLPFAYALVYTRPDTCKTKRELCQKMALAYAGAAKMIQEKPGEVLEKILSKRFDKMDPMLLKLAWEIAHKAHAKDIKVTPTQLDNSQKVSVQAKLLDPKDVVKSYEGIYTDEFVR